MEPPLAFRVGSGKSGETTHRHVPSHEHTQPGLRGPDGRRPHMQRVTQLLMHPRRYVLHRGALSTQRSAHAQHTHDTDGGRVRRERRGEERRGEVGAPTGPRRRPRVARRRGHAWAHPATPPRPPPRAVRAPPGRWAASGRHARRPAPPADGPLSAAPAPRAPYTHTHALVLLLERGWSPCVASPSSPGVTSFTLHAAA